MKTIVSILILFVAGFLAIDYAGKYAMGGIESGLPGGGDGKYSDFHENNFFAYFLSGYDDDYKPADGTLTPMTFLNPNVQPDSHRANCGAFKRDGHCSCRPKGTPTVPSVSGAASVQNPFVRNKADAATAGK